MKFKEEFILLVFMVREMFSFVAEIKDHGHIHKMDHSQYQHDPAGHGSDAGEYFRPAIQGFPGPDHPGSIPQVEPISIAEQRQ